MGRKALVLGATGLVGGHLVEKLAGREEYSEIKIIGRRATGIIKPKIKETILDMENLTRHPEEFKADDIYCCLGTTMKKAGSKEAFMFVDYDLPLLAGKLALQGGAKRFFIISAMGANRKSAFYYSRVKGEMEREAALMPFSAVHIFRPSLLVGDRKEFRFGEKLAKWITWPFWRLMSGKLLKFAPIAAETVAEAMVAIALGDTKGIVVHESDEIAKLGKMFAE
ncbi:NAD-dependent epimerase/dehydratase family protein [Bacillus sp. FJAT-27245]|uniref:NAD-dependent epimerase/dehydratase family protein n=1 Tax=Bacillus sp. FJAT-27245 TaxID=1684144 RepID=UPI000B14F278|nr:NAD-dependent epimerase/dehydratase family protein [Bacillus sp. FJAT-27245]